MIITNSLRKAYSEVDEIIELLPTDIKQKIPQDLLQIIKEEKDKEYIKNINPNVNIEEQDLLEETLAIIAMINLNYICEDEEEKQRLKNLYASNEKEYQDLFQVDFNIDEVFGVNQEYYSPKEEKQIVLAKKENILIKFFKKILKIGGRV